MPAAAERVSAEEHDVDQAKPVAIGKGKETDEGGEDTAEGEKNVDGA